MSDDGGEAADRQPDLEPETEADPPPTPLWTAESTRALLLWGVLMVILIAGAVASLGAIGQQYSATAFVQSYLNDLAAHDLDGALDHPGIRPNELASPAALDADALGDLSDIQPVREQELDDGTTLVTMRVTLRLPGAAEGTSYETSFLIERTGTELALYPTWRFSESPVQRMDVRVKRGTSFTINGFDVAADGVVRGSTVSYYVLSPGIYRIGHESEWFTASTTDVVVIGGETASVDIELTPTAAFVQEVQRQVDAFLDSCTEQTVLFPTGCPFGTFFSDRIQGEPVWTIAEYPTVAVTSDEDGWLVPRTRGAAHLEVDVQSLYDGSIYHFDEDVPFRASWRVFVDDAETTVVVQLRD